MKSAVVLFLAILATPAAALSCQKIGAITTCSDGSKIERMGSGTKIYKHDSSGILRSTRCEKIGSTTRCR